MGENQVGRQGHAAGGLQTSWVGEHLGCNPCGRWPSRVRVPVVTGAGAGGVAVALAVKNWIIP